MMSEERITRALKEFGFSTIDTQVYFFLAKQGAHEISEMVSSLNLPERKVRTSLKDLQDKSMIKASIEYPLKFEALPFEELINIIIEIKKEQAKTLKATREELLSSWKSITEKDEEKS
jgi:sugar-specific transcriptional regulator TrmB